LELSYLVIKSRIFVEKLRNYDSAETDIAFDISLYCTPSSYPFIYKIR